MACHRTGTATALNRLLLAWLACCGMLFAKAVHSAPVVEINSNRFQQELSHYVDIFEDKSGTITFDEIKSENFSHQFSPPPLTDLYFGYTKSAYWLRFTVENRLDQGRSLVLEVTPADIDTIDFYGVDNRLQQVLFHKHSGSAVNFNQRDYEHPLYYFDLGIPAGTTLTYYVRLESNKTINAEMTLSTPREHFFHSSTRDWWQGLIFGGLFLLGMVHIGLAFVYKSKSFAYCGILTLSMIVIQGSWNGYFIQFLNTDRSLLDRQLIISVYVSAAVGLLFARSYLDTYQRFPRCHRLLTFLIVVVLLGIPCSWLFDSNINAMLAGIVTVPTAFIVFGVAAYSFFEGYKPARYFLLARTLTIVMVLAVIFSDRGLLTQNFVSAWGMSVSVLIEAFIFVLVMVKQQTQSFKQSASTVASGQNISVDVPVAALCHELRTPISGVMGMTELLLDTPLTAQQRMQVETVRSSGNALLAVINKMSDLAALESGDAELIETSFEIISVVESCIENVRNTSERRNIELIYQVDEALGGLVKGDEQKLQQILNSLIDYAMRYLESGEILLTAKSLSQNYVLFEVVSGKNTFSQERSALRKPDQAAGSAASLNFTIARRFVALFGGELELVHRADGGLRLTFQALLRRQQRDVSFGNQEQLLRGKRLLIVDDNDTCCKIVMQQASLWGMEVMSAGSGSAALILLRAQADLDKVFDLMLVDYDMPGMNGLELIAVIKREQDVLKTKDTLIMILTGASKVPSQIVDKQFDIDRILYKPLSGKGLKMALVEALQQVREKSN
jgi:signal transduction histidine kinase/ActR/RegA family two-component response regulator